MIAKVFGQHDAATLRQIETCIDAGGERGVLCADGNKGYAQPIGGVVAYKDKISLSGVGFDIACGNLAILTDAKRSEVGPRIKSIMDDVVRDISFGIGRKAKTRVDHELFEDEGWKIAPIGGLKEMARDQLGTVGGGNHYVDIFIDEQDRIWVGVHFGSRGLGHRLASYFIKEGGGKEGIHVDPVLLDADRSLGQEYIECMHLAGEYAYAGRDWVCAQVARIVGANIKEEVHNHHNFAWKETHQGRELWVVRKGATPAFPGQKGFVGGSMGDISVVLEGVASPGANLSLNSTVDGAGRMNVGTQA